MIQDIIQYADEENEEGIIVFFFETNPFVFMDVVAFLTNI
jgi:hypothetical protein